MGFAFTTSCTDCSIGSLWGQNQSHARPYEKVSRCPVCAADCNQRVCMHASFACMRRCTVVASVARRTHWQRRATWHRWTCYCLCLTGPETVLLLGGHKQHSPADSWSTYMLASPHSSRCSVLSLPTGSMRVAAGRKHKSTECTNITIWTV